MRIADGGEEEVTSPTATDATILASTGIEIQAPDGLDGWRTLGQYYPRQYRDEALVDSMSAGQFRLIFRGRHRLRFIGRMAQAAPAARTELSLLAARHSRSGDVLPALAGEGGPMTTLAPEDTVTLDFATARETPGLIRDWFLITRGVYTGVAAARGQPLTPAVPAQFALHQNQPNPFSSTTTIAFDVARRERVKIEFFDLAGRRVATVADREFAPGRHTIEWDGVRSSALRRPGVFLCRMTAGEFRAQRKIAVVP